MANNPVFSAEVELFDDADEGLRVECSEPHVAPLAEALRSEGFQVQPYQVVIAGAGNIPNFVAFAVTGGDFVRMKAIVMSRLTNAGVRVSEENLSSPGETNIRLTLDNVSLFR